MRWIKYWREKLAGPKTGNGEREEELQSAKVQAHDLARRTQRLLKENNLAAEIRKALGAGG